MHRAREIGVEGGATTRIHLDGEPFGTLPLVAQVHPGRLSVATPHDGAATA